MKIERTGLILYVRKYDKCVSFYGNILKLDILFRNDELCCFYFYGTYLMVEKEDRKEYLDLNPDHLKNFSCIRMNVENVKVISDDLIQQNVDVDYQKYHWGEVAKFKDPDGNLIAFKDEAGFLEQVAEFKRKLN